jgi:carbon monoxide dehydrogenase subunit G
VIEVKKDIHINKPAAEVFAFITDFAKSAQWQSGLVRSEQTSSGAMGVGTTGVVVQKFMGKEMSNEISVTIYEAPKRYGAKTTSGPVQFQFEATLEEMGGGTHVSMHMTGEAGGFFKLAEGMVQKELEKTIAHDLGKLKELLEG